ncbi:MAG: phosphatidylinositol-3-phosphatase, partial [Pseudonocardiales bacterium]|nr:phosphatidylinositol-3-phosphatase [Pseudonocardiales bacterium]
MTRLLVGLAALALAAPAQGVNGGIPRVDHVVVVVFENHESTAVIGAPDAPTFNALARRYASIDQYDAVAHPSLPNYLALVSGSTQGITDDCTDCTAPGRSIADTLERSGKTWKTYAEGLPSPGFDGASAGRYAKKHDPFLYFPSIASNPRRRAHVVPFPQLAVDVRTKRVPSFSLVVPDL